MEADITRAIESFASERRALAKRERDLIALLNQALPTMGYRVVASDSPSPRPAPAPPAEKAARPIMRPARKALKCPHCERTFAQPLHLGRHLSTTHKGSAAKATAGGGATSTKSQTTAAKKRSRTKRRATRRATATKA